MENAADAGQILISPAMAGLLPPRCLGTTKGPGSLLAREPPATHAADRGACSGGRRETPSPGACPPRSAAMWRPAAGAPEHRPVTVAFLHFEGTDAMIADRGPDETGRGAPRVADGRAGSRGRPGGLVSWRTDVDADGGKLILTAGAPVNTGSDEERMLLALRSVADAGLPIPVRIGVHRGAVFAGDIGPWYRRTYTVMGDAVNLAARLMAKAAPGQMLATADVLDRSDTRFAVEELAPFEVKGKSKPVQAWSVGEAVGSRSRGVSVERFALVGRDREVHELDAALADVGAGNGRLIEIVGEPGVGKTRLLEELRERVRRVPAAARDLRGVHGLDALRRLARAAARAAGSWLGGSRRRRAGSPLHARDCDRSRAPGLAPLDRDPVRRRDPRDARGRDAERGVRAAEAARGAHAVPAAGGQRTRDDRDRGRPPHG